MIILLVSAILLSITTAKYVNDKVIDEAAIVTADSHCLKVNLENTDIFNEDEHMDMHEFINKYLNNKKYGDIICQNTSGMYIEGRTFTQIKSQDFSLSDFSYIPYEHLDKNKLLYGRMPEKRNEVVLDKQLIDKVTEYTSAVSLMYDGYESYVGAKLHGSDATVKYKVVGISDMGEPSVYCSPNVILSLWKILLWLKVMKNLTGKMLRDIKRLSLKITRFL